MRNSEEIAQFLKTARERRKLTATELANRIGVSKGTISRYENGSRKIAMEDIPKFANVLDLTPMEILIKPEEIQLPKVKDIKNEHKYDYYPTPISAGLPCCIDCISYDDVELISISDSIMGKWAGKQGVFITKVNGDSMNRTIPHGSLIAVKRADIQEIQDNDIVVFSHDYEYSVKRIYNDKENQRFIFRPDSYNSNFIDYIVPHNEAENLRIHGKVVVYIVELS